MNLPHRIPVDGRSMIDPALPFSDIHRHLDGITLPLSSSENIWAFFLARLAPGGEQAII